MNPTSCCVTHSNEAAIFSHGCSIMIETCNFLIRIAVAPLRRAHICYLVHKVIYIIPLYQDCSILFSAQFADFTKLYYEPGRHTQALNEDQVMSSLTKCNSCNKKSWTQGKTVLCVLVLIIAGFYSTVGEFSAVTHEQKNVYLLQFRSIVAYRNTDTFPCHHRSLSLIHVRVYLLGIFHCSATAWHIMSWNDTDIIIMQLEAITRFIPGEVTNLDQNKLTTAGGGRIGTTTTHLLCMSSTWVDEKLIASIF